MTAKTLDVPTAHLRSVSRALAAVGHRTTDERPTPGAVGYTTITVTPSDATHRRVTGRPTIVAYGGESCCEETPGYRITSTNATGTTVYTTCADHLTPATATAAMYVGGWGTVTTTVEQMQETLATI